MRTPIECDSCGSEIGQHYEYPWTSRGQDPPEDVFYEEDEVVYGKKGIYCSRECCEGSNDTPEDSY